MWLHLPDPQAGNRRAGRADQGQAAQIKAKDDVLRQIVAQEQDNNPGWTSKVERIAEQALKRIEE
jgi:hypothetical protein